MKCPKCGNEKITFVPLVVNTICKEWGKLFFFLICLSGIVMIISAVICLWIFIEANEIILAAHNNILTLEELVNAAHILYIWTIITTILKVSGITFIVVFIIHIFLPYHKEKRVYSVCQTCGTCVETASEIWESPK